MNKLTLILLFAAMAGGLLLLRPATAQLLPPNKHAVHVKITQGPELDFARDTSAILRWTSDNPGGDDEHFAVAHYGLQPDTLNQTAKSHIRLNRGHSDTVFRVHVSGLQPSTTYYYTVSSEGADGVDDGVKSSVQQFTTSGQAQQVTR
jgi:phosphodiesterase/alkaline phosphatase D-like protein